MRSAEGAARRPLTYHGNDVAPTHRTAKGKARVVYLDRNGQPTTVAAEAWPHELRGLGWHIAAIKKLIAALPLIGSASATAACEASSESAEGRRATPQALLYAHHVALHDRQED